MRKTFVLLGMVLVTINFVHATSLYATDYYVSTTGSDSNSCTSTSNACRTINQAVSKAGAGDTIYVLPGSYGTEQGYVRTSKGGFTITAYDPNDRPQITGTNSNPFYIRIDGSSSDGVTISYLRIRATTSGSGDDYPGVIGFRDGSDSHVVDNCELSYGFSGILTQGGHSHTFTNNHIHHMGIWGSGDDAHCIGWYGSSNAPAGWSQRTLIANNTIEYCEGDGLQDVTPDTSNNVY